MHSRNEARNEEDTRRTAAHCRLFGWVAGKGQCVAGVAGQGRGGVAPALWTDVDAVRAGSGV